MRAVALIAAVVAVLVLVLWRTDRAPFGLQLDQESSARRAARLEEPSEGGREPLRVSSAPAAIGSTRVLLRVVDSFGQPLPAVDLFALSANTHELAGRTDEAGECPLDLDEEHGRVLARKRGFANRIAWLPGPQGGGRTIEIELAREGVLRGRVVLPTQEPVGSGVQVVAIRSVARGWASIGYGRLVEAQDPRCLVAITDDAGAFEIRGCDPDAEYDLLAGGKGHATTFPEDRAVQVRPPTGQSIVLVVHELLAARFRIVVPGTDVVPLESLQRPRRGAYSFFLGREEIRPAPFVGPGIELAGVGRDRKSTVVSEERTFVFAREARFANADLRCKLRLPLHEAAEVRFRPEPLSPETPTFDLPVPPHPSGYGSVEVRFASSLHIGEHQRLSDVVQLEIVPQTQHPPSKIVLALDMDHEARVGLVDGVPMGDYRARVRVRDGGFRYPRTPGLPLHVGAVPAVLSVLDVDIGSIELVLRTTTGAFSGPVQLYVGYGQPQIEPDGSEAWRVGAGALCFFGPPYRIGGLRPGRYRVHFDKPLAETTFVHVVGGQRELVEMEVRERH
ncbi:MAG: hypothetical protein GY711_12280 [bacterium]|nr:hypothetical protein [bacterium]